MKITRINRFRLLVLAAALFLFAPGLSVPALSADLPVVEFGLPSGGVFGLGGQYMIDKKLDRKHGFIAKPRWAAWPMSSVSLPSTLFPWVWLP